MDNELETVTIPSTSSADVTANDNQAGTTENVEVTTTSPSNGQNVESNNVALETESSESNLNDKEETQRNVEAERGKISHLEKNLHAVQQREAAYLESLDLVFSKPENKPAYEAWRQATFQKTGKDAGEWETLYGTGQSDVSANNSTSVQQLNNGSNAQQALDPNEIANRVIQKMKVDESIDKFFEAVPEMNPANATDEATFMEIRRKGEAVSELADSFLKYNSKLSYHEALTMAYNALPENLNKKIQQAEQTGQMIGKARAFQQSSSNATGVSGGSQGNASTTQVNMTRDQKARYETLLRTDPANAKRYASNIASNQ